MLLLFSINTLQEICIQQILLQLEKNQKFFFLKKKEWLKKLLTILIQKKKLTISFFNLFCIQKNFNISLDFKNSLKMNNSSLKKISSIYNCIKNNLLILKKL